MSAKASDAERALFPTDLLNGDRGTAGAARNLLGAILTTTVDGIETAGKVVETEAYLGQDDPASHAHNGRTTRNDAMFSAPGTLYVYLSHGIHHCANVVTSAVGEPAAVLIRALEPLTGLNVMAARRGRGDNLCNGPGRLTQALGIDLSHNYHDLHQQPILLRKGDPVPASEIGTSGRIGVSKAADWPMRFFVKGHPAVKSPRE